MGGKWNKWIAEKRLRKSMHRLDKALGKKAVKERENRILKRDLKHTVQELEEIKERMVVELCPHCEREVMLVWDDPENLNAFCPYCGSRLMLCSCCEQNCDYDSKTDICSEM